MVQDRNQVTYGVIYSFTFIAVVNICHICKQHLGKCMLKIMQLRLVLLHVHNYDSESVSNLKVH